MRVTLNGNIVDDTSANIYRWSGFNNVFSPSDIRSAIQNTPDEEELTLELNSGGGDLMAGYEMYALLKNAKCSTTVEIQSLAASAATVAMCGADRVTASPVAQIMIHLPSTMAEGNQNDMNHTAMVLESNTESILNAYELKCADKCDRKELRTMMDVETWMPASDAQEIGLVDEILNSEATITGESITHIVNSINGLPAIELLRDRYVKAHSAKKNRKKKAEMEIALELARFGGFS